MEGADQIQRVTAWFAFAGSTTNPDMENDIHERPVVSKARRVPSFGSLSSKRVYRKWNELAFFLELTKAADVAVLRLGRPHGSIQVPTSRSYVMNL